MSGRTAGDLITVFDLPPGYSAGEVAGQILPVRIAGAGTLVLYGRLEAPTRSPSEHDPVPASAAKLTQLEMSESADFAS